MISTLECQDFPKKEYFDEIDDCPVFIRKESCNHYEIKMKRESENYIFKQYIIKFVCKECNSENQIKSNAKEYKFQYECRKCKYPAMSFHYINTAECNSSENDVETSKIKPNNNEDYEFDINKGYENYIADKVRGKNEQKKEEKAFYTPVQNVKKENNNDTKTNIKKGYSTPLPQNINSKNTNKKNFKLNVTYKDSKKVIEFNPEESIESQYNILKKTFNLVGIKKIYFNSNEIDLKKTFTNCKIRNDNDIEIEDE